jgi:lysozyme
MPTMTPRIICELAAHEGLIREAYKDSVDVWTWSIGITNSSGHSVHPRYLDKPQTLERCLEIYIWLLTTKYLPGVEDAFSGHSLTEGQLGAALSFHYNTGGIRKASWVKRWKAGDTAGAKSAFMNWSNPPEIIPRREKERDLFFDGTWTGDGRTTEYQVRKPSYKPNWSSGVRVDIAAIVEDILNG